MFKLNSKRNESSLTTEFFLIAQKWYNTGCLVIPATKFEFEFSCLFLNLFKKSKQHQLPRPLEVKV